jgi:glycoside/pentoside/hexuronide:cation symporter, GPH family
MNAPVEVEKSEKVPVLTKIAFGVGDVGPAIVTAISGFFLLFFFTDIAGLPPSQAGLVLLLSILWDAITDPIVGTLSDRTKTRLGRRRPYMLFGAIPFGISFFLLFWVPPLSGTALAAYYLLALVFHKTMYTVVNIPYTALTPALTSDYNERTSLNSYRFAFSILAGLIAAVLHPIVVDNVVNGGGTIEQGYLASIALWAVLGTLPFFFSVWGTYERPVKDEEAIPFLQGLKIAISNKAFRYITGIYFLSWLTVQIVQTVVVYYATYWLRKPDLIAPVILAVQGSAFVWLFIWARLSNSIGKKGVYYRGMIFWIVVSLLLYSVQPEWDNWVVIVLGVLAGVGVATAFLVPWSMIPDVVELDELETGQRREGVFYGFFVFFQKVGVAVGLYLISLLLEVNGYITPQGGETVVQPDAALFMIRLLVGPIPAVILAAGIGLVYKFPITKEQHERTLAELAKRKAAQTRAGV